MTLTPFPNNTDVVTVRQGYGILISTIVVFNILNRLITYIGVPAVVTQLTQNKEEEIWKYRNLLLSWFHAFIVGVWDITCFYYYPEVWDDLITHITPYTYYMVAVSTGYFMYDFGDMIAHGKVFQLWQLTLHHIAVTSMFFYNLSTRACIGYTVVAMMCEINSFFLHSRKLLQMLRFKFSSKLYRLNALVNLLTFAFCRGFSLSRITYGMWVEGYRVDDIYYYTLSGSMFIMNGVNPGLFWILLKNDYLRRDYGKVKQPKVQSDKNGKTADDIVYNQLLAEHSIDSNKIE